MLGKRKEPALFKIHKSVMSIARSRYQTGVLETRDNSEIAMLRRLPPDHAEEVLSAADLKRAAIESLPDLVWSEIQRLTRATHAYKVGMTKVVCLENLSEAIETGVLMSPELGLLEVVTRMPIQMA